MFESLELLLLLLFVELKLFDLAVVEKFLLLLTLLILLFFNPLFKKKLLRLIKFINPVELGIEYKYCAFTTSFFIEFIIGKTL
jgi:hypothetical protein